MTVTKFKRECLHPQEIPPDHQSKLPFKERLFSAIIVMLVVAMFGTILTMIGALIYLQGKYDGREAGISIGIERGYDDAVLDCIRNGTLNRCKPRELIIGDGKQGIK